MEKKWETEFDEALGVHKKTLGNKGYICVQKSRLTGNCGEPFYTIVIQPREQKIVTLPETHLGQGSSYDEAFKKAIEKI